MNEKWVNLQGGQKVRVLLAQALFETQRRCFWTNRRTTWTWIPFTGCKDISAITKAC